MNTHDTKPEPLKVGDRYIYTLSSYEPVSINLLMPRITEKEIDMTVNTFVRASGKDAGTIDDEWVAKHSKNLKTVQEFRELARQELANLNTKTLANQKEMLAIESLKERLVQSVAPEEVDALVEHVRYSFERNLQEHGTSIDELIAQGGATHEQLDTMFYEQAFEAAEQHAALNAFIDERGIEISDDEIGVALELTPKQTKELLAEARLYGTLDIVRHNARMEKAVDILVDEAHVTFVQESERQAEARLRYLQEVLDATGQDVYARNMAAQMMGSQNMGADILDLPKRSD